MTFENIFKKERGIFKSLLIVYGLVLLEDNWSTKVQIHVFSETSHFTTV